MEKYFFHILHRAQYAGKHIYMQISYIKNAVHYLLDPIRNEVFMPQQVIVKYSSDFCIVTEVNYGELLRVRDDL